MYGQKKEVVDYGLSSTVNSQLFATRPNLREI